MPVMKMFSSRDVSSPLYLFIDESGNFDFSPKGTKFFTLTGFITSEPVVKRDDLIRLRYRLLLEGIDQEYFHATEDKQSVRNEVYGFLSTLGNTYEVHSIVAEKNRANPALYKETYKKGDKTIERVTGLGLYKKLCECLLQYIFTGKHQRVKKIVVVLGSLFVGDKKKVLLQTLKRFLKEKFPKEQFPYFSFEIYSHQTCADLNCQLADYCCWAIAVKHERKETRPYEVLQPRIKSEFAIFKNGATEYYKHAEKI